MTDYEDAYRKAMKYLNDIDSDLANAGIQGASINDLRERVKSLIKNWEKEKILNATLKRGK